MKMDLKLHTKFALNMGNAVYVKCIEEISELITCLCDYPMNYDHISEEIADVYIAIRRLLVIINNGDDISPYKQSKMTIKYCISTLSRTQKMISKVYLYHRDDHKVSLFRLLRKTYFVLDYIVNKYNLKQSVFKWLKIKEEKDQNILDNGTINKYNL